MGKNTLIKMYKPENFHLSEEGHTIEKRVQSLYYKYRYTGFELLRKIPRDAKVLDIGCGTNMWKPYFDDLYGIDPYNEAADEMIKFEDYTPHKEFNTYLALGSINFYSKEYVEMQIEHLSKITNGGDAIFWRQNTGKKLQKKDFENKYIIQEYINGEELHLDILNDHNGKFISSCLKKKISMNKKLF